MAAPGNSTVLLTLLAAFVACTGYAGGRLHQWYRMGRDRDDAYRDGYDTATRSVFSMAARVISPFRADRAAIRASAAVSIPAPAGFPAILPSSAAAPAACAVAPTSAVALSGSVDALDGSSAAVAGAVDALDGSSAAAAGSSAGHDGGRFDPTSAATPGRPGLEVVAGGSGPAGGGGQSRPEGGPGRSGSGAVPRRPRSGVSAARRRPDGEGGEPAGRSAGGRSHLVPVPDAVESSGRHLVPDELVRAATYRLAPDRVARAKVRGALSPDDLPPVGGVPRASVPKPRSS